MDATRHKDFQCHNHLNLILLIDEIFDLSNSIDPNMILDNLHLGSIQRHELLFDVEKYSPNQFLFMVINGIRVVGKGSWEEREVGKSEDGKFLFKLERA